MTMQKTPLLMSRLMDRAAWIAPDEEIVTRTVTGTHRLTYAESARRTRKLAGALAAHGVRPGDRVASFMWNGYRHLEMYHAVPAMGAVLHTLNIRLSPRDLEYIINHAADRVIVIDADLLPLLEQLDGRMGCVERIVVCSEDGSFNTRFDNAIDYEEFIAGGDEDTAWPELDENAPMGLCYTSGTTGNPKGVMYTNRSTYLHTISVSMTDVMGLSATDSPMFHAMSWGLPFAANMLGMKQVMPHRFMDAVSVLDLFAEEEVTISAGVPTIWQGVRAAIEAEPGRWNLEHLQRVTCGGSAPPLSLIDWFWTELGVEMIQGWGMTETNPLGTIGRRVGKRSQRSLTDEEKLRNSAKAGQLIPGLEMEIVDEEFNPLPHDGETVGELLIRGPWIAAEYFNDPQPEKFHDGWLVTGDVAKIDRDQNLLIADRSKDLIKSGGEWISSVDLENHICGMAGVAQAAVVAQPHPKWDERPVAVIVPAVGAAVSADEVIGHCETAFAKWQLPDDVLIEESIPLTSTGKIDKKCIRADLEQRGYRLPDLR
jgi:acyl-CoA synthetase (AMP-forming)/AMP-acid ligase II